MKNRFKIFLLILCILFSYIAVIFSTTGTDLLKADEHYQIQSSTNIDDETYAVLVFTGSKIYVDLFEFEAGDKFIVTSQDGDFTGTWSALDILTFTYFTAKVSAPVITTTTTTISETNTHAVQPKSDFINIWGFVSTAPPPFDNLGFMIGGGAYLGKESFFLGITQRDVTGDPEFGSITPSEGSRESTVNCTITASNTTFRDDPPVDVTFSPTTGTDLIVSNISVVSNEEIEFDLGIAVDAALGVKTVTVIWDDPPRSVSSDSVSKFFTVIE